MKIEFIRRGAETRLILIFAGWSTDTEFYAGCIADGWDTAVVSDYRDMTPPQIPSQYTTVYIFAYSLGVWAAARSNIPAAARVAIFGTPRPVSDDFGIPPSTFTGTANGLCEKSLAKFHLRMAGCKTAFEKLSEMLPSTPKVFTLKEELLQIAKESTCDMRCPNTYRYRWHRAYIANSDRIIPTENQIRYWQNCPETETVILESPHFADIATIIRQCIPNPRAIGEGFANALPTYRKYAIVQAEICQRIGEILGETFSNKNNKADSLLEIGPGKGLLTEEWSKVLKPAKATYVDLYELQLFGKAADERYLVRDAEEWLESTDEKFDVILSASAIQWFADPIRFISTVRSHLNPGGMAVISTFARGNLRELDTLRPSPIIYHSADEYASNDGTSTETWERVLNFESSRELLLHLKRTGVKPSSPSHCLNNEASLSLCSLPTSLTYTPLIITL